MGAAMTAGCGSSSPTSPTTDASSAATRGGAASGACVATPSETAGPYPDRLGMLGNSAFFRRDVTEGRPGTPLALTLTIVNTASGCTALANASVEIWQCDAAGNYSEYAQPGYDGTGQTFLRGLQTTDAGGQVTFNTVYPGWYAGRATHIHVEVFVGGRVREDHADRVSGRCDRAGVRRAASTRRRDRTRSTTPPTTCSRMEPPTSWRRSPAAPLAGIRRRSRSESRSSAFHCTGDESPLVLEAVMRPVADALFAFGRQGRRRSSVNS